LSWLIWVLMNVGGRWVASSVVGKQGWVGHIVPSMRNLPTTERVDFSGGDGMECL